VRITTRTSGSRQVGSGPSSAPRHRRRSSSSARLCTTATTTPTILVLGPPSSPWGLKFGADAARQPRGQAGLEISQTAPGRALDAAGRGLGEARRSGRSCRALQVRARALRLRHPGWSRMDRMDPSNEISYQALLKDRRGRGRAFRRPHVFEVIGGESRGSGSWPPARRRREWFLVRARRLRADRREVPDRDRLTAPHLRPVFGFSS